MRHRPLVLTSLVLAFTCACSLVHVERPQVELVHVGLESLGLLESSLAVTVRVENPNAFRLTVERGVYTLFLGGDRIGTGATRGELVVPARGSVEAEIVVHLDNLLLLARLHDLWARGTVSYRLEADHQVGGLSSRVLHSVADGEITLPAGATGNR